MNRGMPLTVDFTQELGAWEPATGIPPWQVKVPIIRELDVTENVLHIVQWQSTNVKRIQ